MATNDAMPLLAATTPKQLGFLVEQRALHYLSYFSLLALHQAHYRFRSAPSNHMLVDKRQGEAGVVGWHGGYGRIQVHKFCCVRA